MRSDSLIGIVFVLALFLVVIPASAQWTQRNGPWGGQVTELACKNETVFAGTFGGIYISTDNATSWTRCNNYPIGGMVTFAVKDSTVYAGSFGAFLVTHDNGKTWIDLSAGLPPNFELFTIAIKDNVIYAGFDDDPIHYSTDNGVTWKNTDQLTTTFHLWTHDEVLFAETSRYLYRSINDGKTWTAVDSTHDALAFMAIDSVILIGSDNGIIRSVDRGVTWEDYGMAETEISDFCAANGVIFAASPNGVYRSPDRGAHWTLSDSGLTDQPISSLTVNGSSILAGSLPRGVFRSLDNGASWELAVNGMSNISINDLVVSDDLTAAGCDGGIMLSYDRGKNWQWADIAENIYVLSIIKQGDLLLAGTIGSGLYRSLDNGRRWSLIDSGSGWFESLTIGSTGLFGEIRDTLMFSSDSGTTWNTKLAASTIGAFSVSGDTVTVGTFRQLFRSVNNGAAWETFDTADLVNYAYPLKILQDGRWLFSSGINGIRRSSDHGVHWTNISAQLGDTNVNCLAVSGTTLFAGTSSHGVYVSSSKGESWTSAGMVTPYGETNVLTADATTLYAGTISFGLWERPISDFVESIGRKMQPVNTGGLNFRTYSSVAGDDYLIAAFSVSRTENVAVELFDMSGRKVASVVNTRLTPGSYRHRVNTAGLSTGCYITQMKAGSSSAVSTITVKR